MRCEGCPYKTDVVPPEIKRTDLMVIGEAPGQQEVVKKIPFTGPSGQLLWKAFEKFEVTRDEVSITNAQTCVFPPMLDKEKRKTRESLVTMCCRERLMSEIEETSPKVIIALGAVALQTLVQNTKLKITQERGVARPFSVGGKETVIIPTFHPAYLLRSPAGYKQFYQDLSYATSLVKGNGKIKKLEETRWKLVADEEIPTVLEKLASYPVLAADIETSGLDRREGWIVCFGISWDEGKAVIFTGDQLNNPVFKPEFAKLFANENVTWVWHNGKFDSSFLRRDGHPTRVDEDTMLIHYALDEIRGTHSLKQLASDLLGAEDYDDVLKKHVGKGLHGWADIPRDILYPYLARDCDCTFQIYPKLKNRLDKEQNLVDIYRNILLPSADFLQEVEKNGIHVSFEQLEKVADHLSEQKEEIEERIKEIVEPHWDEDKYAAHTGARTVPEVFNPGSPKQLAWLLYDVLLFAPARGKKKDTAEATLQVLPKHPLVLEILKLRKINKMLSTYVNGIIKWTQPDGRIRSDYMLHGTVTGRLASQNPNMQNIPRDPIIRDIFQAPPGKRLIEGDLDQAELRMLAHLSGDKNLIQVYAEGRKLHHEVATSFYGPNFTPDEYVRAKAINFGIPYGRGEFSISQEHGIPVGEARELIDKWFARFPEAHKYLMAQENKPFKGEFLVSPFGRRRRFPLITDKNAFEVKNEAKNFAISSGASDLNLLAARLAAPKLRELNCLVINLVHDSTMVEAPDDDDVAKEVEKILRDSVNYVANEYIQAKLPFEIEAKVGYAWGSLKKEG